MNQFDLLYFIKGPARLRQAEEKGGVHRPVQKDSYVCRQVNFNTLFKWGHAIINIHSLDEMDESREVVQQLVDEYHAAR